MKRKGLYSLLCASIIASTCAAQTAYAAPNQFEKATKVIQQEYNLNSLYDKNFNKYSIQRSPLEQRLKDIPLHPESFGNLKTTNDEDPLYEMEYNDDFDAANTAKFEKAMVGQLLPLYDVDMFKLTVPDKGVVLIGGTTNSTAIQLLFGLFQKDYAENNNLVYLGYDDSDPEVFVEAFRVNKPGTYYINAIDYDNQDDIDNNTEDDLYAVIPVFVDDVAPSKPVINKVDNNDKAVTGKAEANSTISIKNGSKTLGTGKTTSKGTFSVKISVQKANTKLTVTAKDKSGNISSPATVIVADVIPPTKPTINKIDDNDKVVKGKAEANSTVTVHANSKTLGSKKADSKGNYSVIIKPQKAGTNVYVYATDKAGNKSSNAVKKVVKH
ncbi:hypothetical protein SAMN05428981_1011773 [Bacillus sp. OV194]|nr:hypothetical protein SAMN05428981_1011773 [Bacillus sp. OV194]